VGLSIALLDGTCLYKIEHRAQLLWSNGTIPECDRPGATEESCECYQLVRTRLAFHLPKTYT
jgi:hypothetical protein